MSEEAVVTGSRYKESGRFFRSWLQQCRASLSTLRLEKRETGKRRQVSGVIKRV